MAEAILSERTTSRTIEDLPVAVGPWTKIGSECAAFDSRDQSRRTSDSRPGQRLARRERVCSSEGDITFAAEHVAGATHNTSPSRGRLPTATMAMLTSGAKKRGSCTLGTYLLYLFS